MAELDLHDVRDQIGYAVRMPHFDEVLARGQRRRRMRLGATLAAAVLLVSGGALAVAQPSAGDRSIEPADVPPTDPTADQIVDSPDAVLQDYLLTETGVAYSVWDAPCSELPCPMAVAWSDDGWDSRMVARIPSETEYSATTAGFLVVPYGDPAYLISPSGRHVDLKERREVKPATGGEVVVEEFGLSTFRLVDLRTAQSWPAPEPPGIQVSQLDVLQWGEVRAVGTTRNGNLVRATSVDGGVTWSRTPWPASGWIFQHQDHIAVLESLIGTQVSPPSRLHLSSDAGRTWTALEGAELPWGVPDCMTDTSQGLVVTAEAQLWRSTDDTWLHYEQVPDAPEIDCAWNHHGTLVGIGAHTESVFVSTDVGDTWTEMNSR